MFGIIFPSLHCKTWSVVFDYLTRLLSWTWPWELTSVQCSNDLLTSVTLWPLLAINLLAYYCNLEELLWMVCVWGPRNIHLLAVPEKHTACLFPTEVWPKTRLRSYRAGCSQTTIRSPYCEFEVWTCVIMWYVCVHNYDNAQKCWHTALN